MTQPHVQNASIRDVTSLDDLERARRITDGLFAQVKPEAIYDRPIPERHRILFYLGHLEAFDWNLIGRRTLGREPVSRTLDDLFAFGIDPPPGRLPEDRVEDWPSVDRAQEYVGNVRSALDAVFDDAPPELRAMAIEHRLMHAETFSYILHNLHYERRSRPAETGNPTERTLRSTEAAAVTEQESSTTWVEVPAGVARLGRPRGTGFGWDNEFGEVIAAVPAFRMARYKVTNAEYVAFVESGGSAPHYWVRRGDGWCVRGMWAEHRLPADWPVYVSQEQASSFAAWKGKRLPTEAQYHRAAFGLPGDDEGSAVRRFPWGDEPPSAQHGNFDFARPDPVPVTATPLGDSAFGIAQLVGNGWEWTRTEFGPFPGFEPHPAYAGYSADFFDAGHYVLKGASPVTDRLLLRSSFRNWFRPHYPYAYATFRLVED